MFQDQPIKLSNYMITSGAKGYIASHVKYSRRLAESINNTAGRLQVYIHQDSRESLRPSKTISSINKLATPFSSLLHVQKN